jgi:hypothetical protein
MAKLCRNEKESQKKLKLMNSRNTILSRRIKKMYRDAKAAVLKKTSEEKIKQLGSLLAEVAEVLAEMQTRQAQYDNERTNASR